MLLQDTLTHDEQHVACMVLLGQSEWQCLAQPAGVHEPHPLGQGLDGVFSGQVTRAAASGQLSSGARVCVCAGGVCVPWNGQDAMWVSLGGGWH